MTSQVFFKINSPPTFGYLVQQKHVAEWLTTALRRTSQERNDPIDWVERSSLLYHALAASAQIDTRRSCLEDYTHGEWARMQLYREDTNEDGIVSPWYRPSLERRSEIFAKTTQALSRQMFEDLQEAPDYLIQVSCTGYDSPHAVQKLALAKNWHLQSKILHIGHLGCYASIPALGMAAGLLSSPYLDQNNPTASLFLIELCSLHLRLHKPSPEQIVINSLFSDGAVRIDLSRHKTADGFELLAIDEQIIPDSADFMLWRTADAGFQMILSADVPATIKKSIASSVDRFLGRHGLTRSEISRFAIHPGGRKIIESVAQVLEISIGQYSHSKQVFRKFGNMSSCTLPTIWQAMSEDPEVQPGELIVSMAFGPGLTVALNLIRKT